MLLSLNEQLLQELGKSHLFSSKGNQDLICLDEQQLECFHPYIVKVMRKMVNEMLEARQQEAKALSEENKTLNDEIIYQMMSKLKPKLLQQQF